MAALVVYVRELGGISLIAMLRALVVEPTLLVAVTIYVPAAVTTVGVPEITPVEVFKLIPNGKEGLTE